MASTRWNLVSVDIHHLRSGVILFISVLFGQIQMDCFDLQTLIRNPSRHDSLSRRMGTEPMHRMIAALCNDSEMI